MKPQTGIAAFVLVALIAAGAAVGQLSEIDLEQDLLVLDREELGKDVLYGEDVIDLAGLVPNEWSAVYVEMRATLENNMGRDVVTFKLRRLNEPETERSVRIIAPGRDGNDDTSTVLHVWLPLNNGKRVLEYEFRRVRPSTTARLEVRVRGGVAKTNLEGLYHNTIPDMTPRLAYAEFCIKGGALVSEPKRAGEPTSGGKCLPGDLGWIIERDRRDATSLAQARLECLFDQMRLPEPFEWAHSCSGALDAGLNDMPNQWEWASNSAFPTRNESERGAPDRLQAGVMGLDTCEATGASKINEIGQFYRCAR